MIRRLSSQLPEWARPDHPILRYELSRSVTDLPRRARYLRALAVILIGFFLLTGGYLYATNLLRDPAGTNLTDGIWRILYFPALTIQVLLRLIVLSVTINTVSEERRKQTWDNLRATEAGAELALRTRWAAVFYKMRGLLGVLMLVRFMLILGILYDLTAFRGEYLNMLTANITPDVSWILGVALLAFIMTASILLPLTGMGVDAALGLLISTLVKQRVYSSMIQIMLIILRVAIVLILLFGMTQFSLNRVDLDMFLLWLLVFAFAAMGDWGLILLQLGALGDIWARVPYSVIYGLALLAFVMLQAVFTDAILSFAVRRAERHE